MSIEPIESAPQQTATEMIAELVAAGASAVPFAGGVIQAILERLFGHSLQRRTETWNEKLVLTVNELAEWTGRPAEDVADDPSFVSAVIAATQIAAGQHIDEKLDMLRAVLQHSVLDPTSADVVTMRYLRWVDELDPVHVVVLRYARDPTGWYRERNLEQPNYMAAARRTALDGAGLGIGPDVLQIVLGDLGQRGLADVGALSAMVTGGSVFAPWITTNGVQWLEWITLMDPPDA